MANFIIKSSEVLFKRYKNKVKYWKTFNEINILRSLSNLGIHSYDSETLFQAKHHVFLASAKAIKIGKKINSDFQMGMMVCYSLNLNSLRDCKPENIIDSIQFNRELEFYVDVQVKGYYSSYKLKEFSR